jgi:molecular chaperone DnaK
MAKDNRRIGQFDLADIPPSPRGMPQIEVIFDIDADGILHVSAKDKQTNKEQKIRIEASSGLNEQEINKAIKDAEEHAEEDKKMKEKIGEKNELDALIFRAEKSLKDYADKLPENVKTEIQGKIDASKEALKTDDTETMKKAKDELNQTIQKIGESLKGASPQGGESTEKQGPDNMQDAEVEVLDPENK